MTTTGNSASTGDNHVLTWNLPQESAIDMTGQSIDLDQRKVIVDDEGYHYADKAVGLCLTSKETQNRLYESALRQHLVKVRYQGPPKLSPANYCPTVSHINQTRIEGEPLCCNFAKIYVVTPNHDPGQSPVQYSILTPLQLRSWSRRLRAFKLSMAPTSHKVRFVVKGNTIEPVMRSISNKVELTVPQEAKQACQDILVNFSVAKDDKVSYNDEVIIHPERLSSLDHGLGEASLLHKALLRRLRTIRKKCKITGRFHGDTLRALVSENGTIRHRLQSRSASGELQAPPDIGGSLKLFCHEILASWRACDKPTFVEPDEDTACYVTSCPCAVLFKAGVPTQRVHVQKIKLWTLPLTKPAECSISDELYHNLNIAILMSHTIGARIGPEFERSPEISSHTLRLLFKRLGRHAMGYEAISPSHARILFRYCRELKNIIARSEVPYARQDLLPPLPQKPTWANIWSCMHALHKPSYVQSDEQGLRGYDMDVDV